MRFCQAGGSRWLLHACQPGDLCAGGGCGRDPAETKGREERVMLYLRLFWEFFKTGLFAIGGGMATIPFLYDISDATGWFSSNDLANMIAVSESTPGPIGVNMATYVGFVTGMNRSEERRVGKECGS